MTLAALREALTDPSLEVVVAALAALAYAGSEADLDDVARLATSPDERTSGTARATLTMLGERHPARARDLALRIDPTGIHAVVGCALVGAAAEGEARPGDLSFLRAALDH